MNKFDIYQYCDLKYSESGFLMEHIRKLLFFLLLAHDFAIFLHISPLLMISVNVVLHSLQDFWNSMGMRGCTWKIWNGSSEDHDCRFIKILKIYPSFITVLHTSITFTSLLDFSHWFLDRLAIVSHSYIIYKHSTFLGLIKVSWIWSSNFFSKSERKNRYHGASTMLIKSVIFEMYFFSPWIHEGCHLYLRS